MYQRIQQQAGFIEFSELHFDDAQELFRDGGLDVREVSALSICSTSFQLHKLLACTDELLLTTFIDKILY